MNHVQLQLNPHPQLHCPVQSVVPRQLAHDGTASLASVHVSQLALLAATRPAVWPWGVVH